MRTVNFHAERVDASNSERSASNSIGQDVAPDDMSKHTPGPWFVSIDPRYPAEPCVDAMVDGTVWHIALCHNGPGPEESASEANAHLIAAAPELLAVLKEALPSLRAQMQRLASSSSQMAAENVNAFRAAKARYDAAVAAIKKAEALGSDGDGAPQSRKVKLYP